MFIDNENRYELWLSERHLSQVAHSALPGTYPNFHLERRTLAESLELFVLGIGDTVNGKVGNCR